MRRAVVLISVVVLAGCGSAEPAGVKPVAWAKAVCGALSPWRTKLDTLTSQTQRQLTAQTTPSQAKQNLVGLLAGMEDASETARGKVAGAGTPAVDDGAKIAERFVRSLTGVRDAYGHARTTVAGLDARDGTKFYAAVRAAFGTLRSEYAATALDTDKFTSGSLRKAFNEVPECH